MTINIPSVEEIKDVPAVDPRNKLNDLTASEWISRTVSVFGQKGLGRNSHKAKIERQHPAPFSFQDVARFIEFFTKRGETVLDPFCGVGSTLKASAILGRDSIGVELNPKYVALAQERMKTEIEPGLLGTIDYKLLEGDIREKLPWLADASIDFIITSPPYWGILNKIDHKAKQERLVNGYDHNYGWDKADLAQIHDYSDFVHTLGKIFDDLARPLTNRRYLVVIVGDFRHKQTYCMLHADLAAAIERRGNFDLKGITIIHQKFKRVFPYGYPYSYVPNIHHQYALIFQKNK